MGHPSRTRFLPKLCLFFEHDPQMFTVSSRWHVHVVNLSHTHTPFSLPFNPIPYPPFLSPFPGVDSQVKVWDVRTFKPMHAYFANSPATSLDISQKGLLAVGQGRRLQVGLGFRGLGLITRPKGLRA